MYLISCPKSVLSSRGTYWAPLCVYFTGIHWRPILCSSRFTFWHCRTTEYARYESENSQKRNTIFRLQTSQNNKMPLVLLQYSIKTTLFFSSENVDTAVSASCVLSTVVLCYRFLFLLQTNAESHITHSVHYSYNQSHLPTNAHYWVFRLYESFDNSGFLHINVSISRFRVTFVSVASNKATDTNS